MNLSADEAAAVEAILRQLEQAWNAGDAARFAAAFAADAEQVNIFGSQLLGRAEIQERHGRIFETIFQGSANTLRLVSARKLSDGVLLARVSSRVAVPRGPMAGSLETLISIVLQRGNAGWQIVSFHNTRVSAG